MKMGHMQMSLKGDPEPGDEAVATKILSAAAGVLSQYRDVKTAVHDSYKPFFPSGKIGEEIHYTNYRYRRLEQQHIESGRAIRAPALARRRRVRRAGPTHFPDFRPKRMRIRCHVRTAISARIPQHRLPTLKTSFLGAAAPCRASGRRFRSPRATHAKTFRFRWFR
jgi:hypothetical protein